MSLTDMSPLEELCAQVGRFVDPAGLATLVGDFVEPVLVRQARLGAEDLLQPDVFSQVHQHLPVHQVLRLDPIVDGAHAAVLVGQLEYVGSDQMAELLEDKF